jgi:hypothetical protein
MWFSCSARLNLRLRTRRLRTSTRNTEDTTSLYCFGPPESKTLLPVVGVDCLKIVWLYKGRLARLILVSGWGRFPDSWSVMTWRPKSILQLLSYPSICFGRNPLMSCLARQFLWSFWIRSSGESSGRSSGSRVGRQLGRLAHWQIGGSSGRPDLLVMDGREPGRWGPKGTHVSQFC